MKTLHTPLEAARWLRQRVTGQLCTDSRLVQPGDAFIAWPGAAPDGRLYLPSALNQGAQACVLAQEGSEPWQALSEQDQAEHKLERLACMADLKAQTGPIAAAYYEHPSEELGVLAVTGTNGKTSSTWWLAQALSSPVLRSTCGLIGTLGVGQLPHLSSPGMTRFAWRCAPISRKTIWITTAAWRLIGQPNKRCSIGQACKLRSSMWMTRKGRIWPSSCKRVAWMSGPVRAWAQRACKHGHCRMRKALHSM